MKIIKSKIPTWIYPRFYQPRNTDLLTVWYITGTYHDSFGISYSEGNARRYFHHIHHGESILYCSSKPYDFSILRSIFLINK